MAIQPIRVKKAEPSARIIDLTPEYAAELLDRNPRNRNFSKRNSATVLRAVANGEWELNGEAIKIDTEGYILDGQHRCWAVVESGVTIRTFIIDGLPASTQDTMDTGKSRSLGDVLAIHGEANASSLASIVRILCQSDKHGLQAALGNKSAVTVKECLAYLDANPWIREMIHPARRVANHTTLSATVVAALWVAFAQIDNEDAEYFFDRLVDGVELEAGSPIRVLRSSLEVLSKQKGERNRVYLSALTIKAWNAYREGRPISLLKFRPGGSKPEPFPEPR